MSDTYLACGCSAMATTIIDGKEVLSCPVHLCTTIADKPSLEGREARCGCFKVIPSSWNLAFFEYRGPGSRFATETCRVCGMNRDIHPSQGGTGRFTGVHKDEIITYLCENNGKGVFTPGAHQYDSYYCGHSGWD